MSKRKEMLELQRKISDASSQISTVAKIAFNESEVSADVQHLLEIVKEKADYIKNCSPQISSYLEFTT